MSEQQSTMRDLLARWAAVEPERCRRETVGDFERLLILSPRGWQMVWDEEEPGGYYPTRPFAEAFTQYVVQQAIVSRGWPLELEWDEDGWYAWINDGWKESAGNNAAEALLAAYLQALENKKAG